MVWSALAYIDFSVFRLKLGDPPLDKLFDLFVFRPPLICGDHTKLLLDKLGVIEIGRASCRERV